MFLHAKRIIYIFNLLDAMFKCKIETNEIAFVGMKLICDTSDRYKCSKLIYILDIIHHSVSLFKTHNVSETGLCLRPQAKACAVGPNR
jgi:hypothetical protein